MSKEMNFSEEELDTLDRIDSELQSLRVRGTAVMGFSSIEPADLCQKYQAIKAYLKILVKLIRKVPKIGEKVADAIEFLMSLADIACPA